MAVVTDISVVVPVYYGADCLVELARRVDVSLAGINVNYELILGDDRSPDRSWSVITRLAEADARVKAIRFSRNFGQHNAITAGLDHATGNWIVVMDCDLQDLPEEIPRLYKKALEGYDVVVARRGARQDNWTRLITSRMFYLTFRILSGMKYDHEVGNFRIISKKVGNYLRDMREQLRFFGGLVEWIGFPVATIDVTHGQRFAGESSYNWPRLIRLASSFIIAHSDRPLKVSIVVGFFFAVSAFGFGTYILLRTLIWGTAITGWASLIVSVYFMGGLILAFLGMIGVYLGKVFQEAKRRPLYVVDCKINS